MKKILVIEDNDKNRDIVVQILEDDYQIIEAIDGEMGVKLAETELPDLILMDISLPKLDGIEATRLIKKNQQLNKIPIIAITANAMVGDKEKILEAGCDDYMSKPIFPSNLISKVKKYLQ